MKIRLNCKQKRLKNNFFFLSNFSGMHETVKLLLAHQANFTTNLQQQNEQFTTKLLNLLQKKL